MSLCYDNCSKNSCDKDCIPNKIILGCKNISISGILKPPIEGMNAIPETLESISVDFKCLRNPCIEIDVNTIIESDDSNFQTTGTTLTFRVFKSCDDEPEKEIKSIQYNRGLTVFVSNKIESFNFTICDCDPCPKCCCTYRIEVEATSDIPFQPFFTRARILGGTITVVGFSKCND